MKRTMILAALSTATAMGCSAEVTVPEDDASTAMSVSSPCRLDDARLTVMTQNVYLGMDVDPVLGAPSEEAVPVAVAAAWRTLEANRFEDRAAAIAASIGGARPELVALQEVALYRRFPGGGGAPTEIDFLAILRKALAKRALPYRVAVVENATDVMVPMFAGFDASGAPILDGVQVLDRDAILVRADVEISEPRAARYEASLPVAVGSASLEIVRGWASVIVKAAGGSYRFMTTHLEDHVPEIQAAQAAELLAIVNAEKRPIVVAGDFNSPADGSGTPTYAALAAAGLRDAWSAAHPKKPGFTCCRASDLRLAAPLTERLDLIFARGRTARPIPGAVSAELVGEERRDRTPSGLWPSDHAGVVATFRAPTLW
ncbi:MAG: endonuclease/exonuclease/phosphatase family protein [Labilithrix sp.]|nr:endonuclease/exonuclease/phosphatase family protein [Labilithrix sp.]